MNTSSFELKVGIIGLGMVGDPIRKHFEAQGYRRGHDLFLHDRDQKNGFFDDTNKADIIFVALPTPPSPDGSCDTSIVENVVEQDIADGKIVVIKSTVPPGTTSRIQYLNPDKFIMFNPEFLTEAQSLMDYLKPVRQIVAHTDKSRAYTMMVKNLLPEAPWSVPSAITHEPLMELNSTEAEIVKYASNLLGSIKVTFANILFDMCQVISKTTNANVDWEKVRVALAADPRIGPSWLNVNHGRYRGFGGFCFPKDFRAIMALIKSKVIRGDTLKSLRDEGIKVLEAIWNYNKHLLGTQELTIEDVSSHNEDLDRKLEKK
jgi:UDPglucose 6-dehydrogenase